MASLGYLIGMFLGGALGVLLLYTPYYLYKQHRTDQELQFLSGTVKFWMVVGGLLNVLSSTIHAAPV